MYCVLRFFANPDQSNQNALISRTLGKICFIDNAYRGPHPEPGDFWLSNVVKETRASRVAGCFLAEPFQKVAYESLIPISPLSCTVLQPFPGTLVIDPVRLETPEGALIPWIVTKNHKAKLMADNVIAVLVNLGGDWWERR
ncbi:MAG: hypothetical protein GWN58_23500 [Anaerolineae bacterium]|nr:hypothetical protein [Thermoplasmata archaeon]NIV32297.1 hypothetical protein [Anaerolineae bacterium]NIY03751.1 hypothetical protein [Thermoplasmata archaeon]